MTDENTDMSEQAAKQQAAEYVVEEAQSWHEGSPKETVKEKLEEGLDQAGVSLPADNVEEIARDIHESQEPEVGAAE